MSKLLSIFSKPLDRRTGKYTLRRHELGHGWRIIKVSNGRCVGTLSELRRASDLANGLNLMAEHGLDLNEMPLPEWQQKIRRIKGMIEKRKERWVYSGQVPNEPEVDDERAA